MSRRGAASVVSTSKTRVESCKDFLCLHSGWVPIQSLVHSPINLRHSVESDCSEIGACRTKDTYGNHMGNLLEYGDCQSLIRNKCCMVFYIMKVQTRAWHMRDPWSALKKVMY